MEDVLDVYQRPYNPKRPLVCVDEMTKELNSTPYGTLPLSPDQPQREDYEYERHGTVNVFMSVEPLAGKRRVRVTERHTRFDFAEELRCLVEDDYPEAEQIVLVTDNLRTHSLYALYETFPAEQARNIARKLEWHYTPEHGSWLNIAETELSALSTQCTGRRMASREVFTGEVAAWEKRRNERTVRTLWQFRTEDARLKLRRLYPEFKQDSKLP